ncbi:hypothetical protein ACEPAF_5289 [Sanghuangporus sanghuang]
MGTVGQDSRLRHFQKPDELLSDEIWRIRCDALATLSIIFSVNSDTNATPHDGCIVRIAVIPGSYAQLIRSQRVSSTTASLSHGAGFSLDTPGRKFYNVSRPIYTMTTESLEQLESLYPTTLASADLNEVDQVLENPWYIVAIVAYSASNGPDVVPHVLRFVLTKLIALSATGDDKRRAVVRMREALFKAGLISGYSRAISALVALYKETPDELRDTRPVRETESLTVSNMLASGDEFFSALHGSNTESINSTFYEIHPDMGWFGRAIVCGHVWGAQNVLSRRETSFILVAANIAMQTPTQIVWHLESARRAGASTEEINAVREIAMRAAAACGVQWPLGVPKVREYRKCGSTESAGQRNDGR